MGTQVRGTCMFEDRNPCRKPCREQFIFLLEFYVHCIRSPRLAKLNQMFCVPTTVFFRFLDFRREEDLCVTPVDPMFEPQAGIADDVEPFNSGKSVLFALGTELVSDVNRSFKIELCVCKRMPLEVKPDVLVGRAVIDMSLHFAALRKEIIDSMRYSAAGSAVDLPSKCFEDSIPMCYEEEDEGLISVYCRLSAYGQTIVTEFDTPCIQHDSISSFLFKANDENCEDKALSYKCRRLDPGRCDLSAILSETGSERKKDCTMCNPPKVACAPCAVAMGAKIPAKPRKKAKASKSEPPCKSNASPSATGFNSEALPVGPGCKPDNSAICAQDNCAGCGPIQTSRGPKEPCGKAVVLKVSGLLDIDDPCRKGEARVTVAPESEATCPDLCDPDHDIFILRIGKKGLVGAGEKSDIQLEMRTPKGPERRPAQRLETREVQTDEAKKSKEEKEKDSKKGDKKNGKKK